MVEYIKREDMNNTLDEMCVVDGIYNALQAIHAADVVEVVHGKWIQGNTTSQECSCCGFEIDDDVSFEMYFNCYKKPKFCPECGAKMDSERTDKHGSS